MDLRTNDLIYSREMPGNVKENQIGDYLKATYKEKNKGTGYTNTLLLARMSLPQKTILETFVNNNITQVQKSLLSYVEADRDEKTFACWTTSIDWTLVEFSFQQGVEEDWIIYMGQYFFLMKGVGYVLSFSSEEKDDRRSFSSSLKSLRCQTTKSKKVE